MWHEPQAVLVECGAGGGTPWQVPQASWVVPLVQDGAVMVPPAASEEPWQ
jgi:hypothetical protein